MVQRLMDQRVALLVAACGVVRPACDQVEREGRPDAVRHLLYRASGDSSLSHTEVHYTLWRGLCQGNGEVVGIAAIGTMLALYRRFGDDVTGKIMRIDVSERKIAISLKAYEIDKALNVAQPPTADAKEKPVERKRFESGIDIGMATRKTVQSEQEVEPAAEEPPTAEPPAEPPAAAPVPEPPAQQ